jgi:alkylhydroperoxidase family enzyme
VDGWLEQEPPAGEKLGAMLQFIRKMTLTPDALGPDDVRAVYAAGVTRAAMEDAVHVAMMFNVINRIADGLRFHVPSDEAFAGTAKMLLRFGYEL